MRTNLISLVLILLLLPFTGCKQFRSEEGKRVAQSLSDGRWVVEGPAEGSPGSFVAGSSDCGDCKADIVLWVKSLDGKKSESVCIDSTNSQFADYVKLKGGDTVSFQTANNPVQQKCGSGAFIILKK